MPKEYPGFIIDRSRRSEQSKHSDDYVVCLDGEVGYVAKCYKLTRVQYTAHLERIASMNINDAKSRFIANNYGEIAIILEVVHFLYPPVHDKPKLLSLLKKGLKAYIFGEIASVGNVGIDRQISAVRDSHRLSEAQRNRLIETNGEKGADLFISSLADAVASLELLKKLQDVNGK